MSIMKRTKRSSLLIVAGLIILAITMAACGAGSETAAAPIGLRPAAIDDLVGEDAPDADDGIAAGPATAGTAIPVEDQAPETGADLVTTAARGNNGQARVADRSQHIIDPDTMVEPSPAEIAGLVYMREEEKLARDVYLALYDLWGQPIFQNIAASEQAHMDSVLMLLDQYGVTDPAGGMGPGEFNDPFFRSLYGELVAQGSQSQIEALLVGAAIEELDIVDLQERLAQTSNEYIVQVYTNLLAGSENHLRAFVSNLERQGGEAYQPAYLNQAAYQAIMSGATDRGNGNGGYRGGNGSSGGNGNGRQNGRNNGA
jgi:hypothetical protein